MIQMSANRSSPRGLTLVVFAVQMCRVASVHPPAGAVLLSAAALVLVVVLVHGAELHAVVRRVELVAGIVAEIEAVESVSRVTAEEVAVRQAVHVALGAHAEHGVVGIPWEATREERGRLAFSLFQREPPRQVMFARVSFLCSPLA